MFNTLDEDFGVRKVVKVNDHTIKVKDSDPYYYACVCDEDDNLIKETDCFNPKNCDRMIEDLER